MENYGREQKPCQTPLLNSGDKSLFPLISDEKWMTIRATVRTIKNHMAYYRKSYQVYCTACVQCASLTSKSYARKSEGKCKACFTGVPRADAIVSSGRCEDYPCCGHEAGGCPSIDAQGRQRFNCATCGTLMSHNARSAVCNSCHTRRNRYINEDPTWADHND